MKTEKNYKKLNQANSSLINRLNVFILIKSKKSITRNEISNETGLRASTISYIIRDLKKANLITEIEESDIRSNVKGVKPYLVKIDNQKNYFIGIEITSSKIFVLGVLLDGSTFFSNSFHFSKNSNLINELIEIIKETKRNYSSKRLLGVGVGIPGVVDIKKKEIIISNVLGIRNFKFNSGIENDIGAPLFIENNANAAAYGEYISFYKDKHNYLFFIYFQMKDIENSAGTGIGSGIIIGGEIYHGEMYSAGEIGDIILNAVKHIYKNNNSIYKNFNIYELLNKGQEPDNVEFISKIAFSIGEALGDSINILNPGAVIIGGDSPLDRLNFFENIKKGIEQNIVSFYRGKILIEKSKLGAEAVAKGAAFIAEKNVFTPEYFEKILK